uniref:sulfotransferase domain-containing protein n=1 Tax=uncultured Altererythrobacter sp. TaxID=500840 RepID=UPI002617F057|nr:sulfotransferase domain-containing protein [uncultured Altererythrobacter sp.]
MTLGLGRAARTAEEFGINMMAAASVPPQNFKPLESEPGDVFITTWAKSGTTMMQQMFHQIRMIAATGEGDMDFDDISRMTPWEDTGPLIDYDVNGPQRAQPRGFKSHREYERLPAGGRYVVTLRDPHETYVSFYRFFDGWHIERGALSLEEYMPLWLSGGPGGCDYFTHLLSWYARRGEPDTLLATYRWTVKNKRTMIRRLAEFCELELSEEQVSLVEKMTSREFMHQHLDKFDDKMVAEALEKRVGIPATSDSTKVQASSSDANQVPDSIARQINEMWAERVTPVTGHTSFAELAQELDA